MHRHQKTFTLCLILLAMGAAAFWAPIIPRAPHETAMAQVPEPAKLRVGFPVRLTIPSIDVDALMQYVDIRDDGAMAAPTGPTSVGWFDLGARPGDIGTAVIAGHSGYDGTIAGVFDNLKNVSVGDTIEIRDDQGVPMRFVVRDIKTYDRDADASEVFSSDDNLAHLNLITCDGTWDDMLKTRTQRLVVFTDRIE